MRVAKRTVRRMIQVWLALLGLMLTFGLMLAAQGLAGEAAGGGRDAVAGTAHDRVSPLPTCCPPSMAVRGRSPYRTCRSRRGKHRRSRRGGRPALCLGAGKRDRSCPRHAVPDRRHLLRSGRRKHRRPARGGAGRAQPRAASGLSGHRVRRRLSGVERGHCQFSFACDGALSRTPAIAGWSRAAQVAAAALSGGVYAPVGLATHYHTFAVAPAWNRAMVMTDMVGAICSTAGRAIGAPPPR